MSVTVEFEPKSDLVSEVTFLDTSDNKCKLVSAVNPLPVTTVASGTVSDNKYYTSTTTSSGSFTTSNSFGFISKTIIISNDSSNNIDFSFDGAAIDGTLKTNETFEDNIAQEQIYVKSSAGSDAVRIWAR